MNKKNYRHGNINLNVNKTYFIIIQVNNTLLTNINIINIHTILTNINLEVSHRLIFISNFFIRNLRLKIS